MEPKAINQAIADYCEKVQPSPDEPEWLWQCATGDWVPELFTTDLNAMHEAEKVLSQPEHSDYICHLYYKTMGLRGGICDWRELATATAAQRAEAFLKTLDLWKPFKT